MKRNGRCEHLKPHRWPKGTSGNPDGRMKIQTLSAALRAIGVRKASTRAVLANVAAKVGLEPADCTNVEVVAVLIFEAAAMALGKLADGELDAARAATPLVELILKAGGDTEPARVHVAADVNSALRDVSTALGFDPPEELPPLDERR